MANPSEFLDQALARFQEEVPERHDGAWLEVKKSAAQYLTDHGFPGRKDERYKYSPLRKKFTESLQFTEIDGPVPSVDLEPLEIEEAARLVVINGHQVDELSTAAPSGVEWLSFSEVNKKEPDLLKQMLGRYEVDTDSFGALNTSLTPGGILIRVKKDTVVERPLVIYETSDFSAAPYFIQPRLLILVEENAHIDIVLSQQNKGHQEGITNSVTETVVEQNAHCSLVTIQRDAAETTRIHHHYTGLKRDAHVSLFTLTLSGGTTRNNTQLALTDSGIDAHLYGLYLGHGNMHVDNHTVVDHRKPHAHSNELYKGILNDKATGVFNGKIYVRQDAQKTEAYQSNKNILLTDQATVNTKPQLEIWADDVKCSHGCTTGQIDSEQLFYLQTRGIDKPTARKLLLEAYALDVISEIKNEALRKHLNQLILNQLDHSF